jgi:DNA-binding IclR family transcriptional regulator
MSNSEPPAARAEPSGGVQSVDRAVTVLEVLARRGEARVTDVAGELGVHKSTAFRLLGALQERGLVEQDTDRGRYRLGFGIVRLAGAVTARMDLTKAGRPVCERLAREIGETVNLAVLREHYAVNIDQAQGATAVAAQNWVGQLTPLHATSSGKVLLAYLPDASRDALLDAAGLTRYTDATLTRRSTVDSALESVRGNGYATTVEEYELGLNAVAAPIRAAGGQVVAAVSASGPAYRFTVARLAGCAPLLVSGADEISHRLGYLG